MDEALQQARLLLEAQLSHSEIHGKLRAAIAGQYPDSWVWLRDVYDSEVVAEVEGKPQEGIEAAPAALYRFPYVMTAEGELALGAGAEVRRVVSYEPVESQATESAADLEGDFIPLVEKAVRRDGTVPIKIIQPGRGSSGYYPAEVLERDGPNVFLAGTKMFADHPTPTEEAERPEGSIKNLVAELVTNARYEAAGPAGPGLYADAKVFEAWQPFIEELAPHIGVSIRANGRARMGDVDGQRMPVIEELVSARSVDFVTAAGAGGQVLSLFEAARNRVVQSQPHSGGESGMDETKLKEAEAAREAALAEAETAKARSAELEAENARLHEGNILREARDFVGEALPKDLPELTRTRLLEQLSKNPVVKDGVLDKDEFMTMIEKAVKAEVEYLATVTGSGQIRDMGGAPVSESETEEAETTLEESFRSLGLSESAAKTAARGR